MGSEQRARRNRSRSSPRRWPVCIRLESVLTNDYAACAAANPAITLRLQSRPLAAAVAELYWVVGPILMSTLTIECPHCYSDVLPMADGRCPSCLADTRAPSAEGGCFTKAALQHQAQGLPSV